MLGKVMIAIGVLATFCVGALAFLIFGRMPVNQFHLWKLERDFYHDNSIHLQGSLLLQKKTYVGGPYDHGSQRCGVFVGELRSVPLSKEKIRQAYAGHFKVLFFDEKRWTMNSPLGDWWDEWYQTPLLATSSTVFFVFVSQEDYPSWGDIRCDD